MRTGISLLHSSRNATSLSTANGLARTANAPSSLASATSSGRVWAVIITTAAPGASLLISLKPSTPFMPGILMSIRITSKGCFLTFSMARKALSAPTASYPWTSRMSNKVSTKPTLSSTTRTLGFFSIKLLLLHVVGNFTRKVVPRPTWLSTAISPLLALSKLFETARPKPSPFALVVNRG